MVPDFSGYVTKSGLKCSDGRTILAHAFKVNHGQQVPLVWMHQHDSPDNVLGHVMLEDREDGVYGRGFFNETPAGVQAKALVQHKDIVAMSIFANQLVQQGGNVQHGNIRETSLVLAGANPGAFIDQVNIKHADGSDFGDTEAVIYSDQTIAMGEGSPVIPPKPATIPAPSGTPAAPVVHAVNPPAPPAAPAATTPETVINSMSQEQRDVMYSLIGQALQHQATGAAGNNPQEGNPVTRNVFDQSGQTPAGPRHVVSHDDMKGIMADAMKQGSLKAAVEGYAVKHGIDNLDVMFPDAKAVTDTPDFISRRMDWVAGVLGGTKHTPFSRIKSLTADITQDEARAKGYIKGNLKKEEFFSVAYRVTTPKTIYKKQKLDRDDVIDITDFDVVAWLRAEMRVMLDEELARAVLIGDGREVDDIDKIDETCIRPIATDDDMYTTKVNVNILDAGSSIDEVVDAVLLAMQYYHGTGTPTFYTTLPFITQCLLAKDTLGRRLYPTKADLAAAMGVGDIVPVEAMQIDTGLIGVIVNLTDYTIGADSGGAVSLFDDFDIDYNQYKYLIETRVSGALTKYKSAIAINSEASGNVLVTPTTPTFVSSTGVVTIPSETGVVYKNSSGTTLSSGAQTALSAGASVTVVATPATGYFFATSEGNSWSFTRPAS